MLQGTEPTAVYPFSYNIGPIEITGFGLAVVAAFAIAQIIAQRELVRRGHDRDANAIPDIIIAALLGTVIGAKLYYVAVISHDIRDIFSRGGFVFWGGFIGAVGLCWIVVKWKKLSFMRMADVGGICIAAGYSVGRTGCWAVGDDYGRPWNSPLAVTFPDGMPPSTAENMSRLFGIPIPPGTAPDTVLAVHPTQLYETVLGFLMFAMLWRYRDHKHAEGWMFGFYCVLAGVERFIIEFFRAKDDQLVGPLTIAQVIALAIAAVGVAWMAARWNVGDGKRGIYAHAA